MKKRMFLYTTFIISIGFLLFFTASVYVTYHNSLNLAKESVREITGAFAGLYDDTGDLASFLDTDGDTRITVISSDGTVLADSQPVDVGELENHLDRPEIQAAKSGSPRAHIRYSETLGADLIYYARKVKDDDGYVFIRAAIPVAKIDAYLFRSIPLLAALLLAVALLCFFFTKTMVHKLILPFDSVEQKLRLIANGEYRSVPVAESYEEINKITREIDDIAVLLQKNLQALRDGKSKLDYIVSNIGDGILAIDKNKTISLINPAALGIFHAEPDVTGKNLNYLYYDKSLCEAVEECVNFSKNALFELSLNGNIYLVTVKKLTDADLTMVILSNVTENRENAKRREEFFTNASHELKTPLTAIKGFNELTMLHNKDTVIQKYIDSIARETDRMLSLIEDMLKLSEFENAQTVNPIPLSLSKIIKEAGESLSASIEEKSIIFKTSGDGTVMAEPGHAYELVKNLIENAIRYNHHGGKISVTVENSKKSVYLTVADNGIGISPQEHMRIFERFYRVEKSRSQRNGGTGLGLSIVKHVCVLYHWKLSLKSRPGVGTEITVMFGNKPADKL